MPVSSLRLEWPKIRLRLADQPYNRFAVTRPFLSISSRSFIWMRTRLVHQRTDRIVELSLHQLLENISWDPVEWKISTLCCERKHGAVDGWETSTRSKIRLLRWFKSACTISSCEGRIQILGVSSGSSKEIVKRPFAPPIRPCMAVGIEEYWNLFAINFATAMLISVGVDFLRWRLSLIRITVLSDDCKSVSALLPARYGRRNIRSSSMLWMFSIANFRAGTDVNSPTANLAKYFRTGVRTG